MIRVFRHYISTAFLSLSLLETAIFASALQIGNLLRFKDTSDIIQVDFFIPSIIFAIIMLICMTGMGLYQRHQGWKNAAIVLRFTGAFLLATLGMALVFYALPGLFVGRGILGFSLLYAFAGVAILRALFYRFADEKQLKRRILIYGVGKKAQQLIDLQKDEEHSHLHIVGCISMDNESQIIGDDNFLALNVPLIKFVTEHDVDEIVVAPDDRRGGLPVDDLLDCKISGYEVIDALTFYEREAGIIKLDSLYPSWLVFSDGFKAGNIKDLTKRSFDVFSSLLILFFTWPFMVIAAFFIFAENGFKGPIFYTQTRVGAHWHLFKVIKLRSMRVDAEKDGAQWAQKNDARITPVGRFIRKTRIDELPQILNVLKGDMSFVGPRPERPEFVDDFATSIPYYSERHRVKPGITGWAQLCYPYGASEDDAARKLEYDLYYVKNYSLFLDMLILLQTTEVILWGKGAQ
ncbi:MAG: sugar transferase [Piscirickettsiaceae bacterium]|nr:MAG: sugar transferase [Piscirickettsiaceae bacterium]PCI69937.1 MAG: sugar transferase [Piscirickettsiaceae bacterium]